NRPLARVRSRNGGRDLMHAHLLKARALFNRLSVREKLLALLFLIVILIIWTSSLMGRVSIWTQDRQQAQTDLTTQQQWLSRHDEYSQGLRRALERVDPTNSYSGAQHSGRTDAILREAGLVTVADIAPVRTREGEIFN